MSKEAHYSKDCLCQSCKIAGNRRYIGGGVYNINQKMPNTNTGEKERWIEAIKYVFSGGGGGTDTWDSRDAGLKAILQEVESHTIKQTEEKMLENIRQLTIESWHEAQTLLMSVCGKCPASPAVNLDKMGMLLHKKLASLNQTQEKQ